LVLSVNQQNKEVRPLVSLYRSSGQRKSTKLLGSDPFVSLRANILPSKAQPISEMPMAK
jgi:hypothetical protein